MSLLKKEERLSQIVKLVGPDSLPDNQRLILFVADMIKKGFLQQNAYDTVDMYSTIQKQATLLKVIMEFYKNADKAIQLGAPLIKIRELGLGDEIIKLKSVIPNEDLKQFDVIFDKIRDKFDDLSKSYRH
jgi:V/A-type H+-transporting ATPase subunit A